MTTFLAILGAAVLFTLFGLFHRRAGCHGCDTRCGGCPHPPSETDE